MKRTRKSVDRMASKGPPNPIDVHVGRRIQLRRTLLQMSQSNLAEALGLACKQVQKYEKGTNRVSSSRLFDLARVLDVPVPWFFEEMAANVKEQSPSKLMATRRLPQFEDVAESLGRRETIELVRAYYRIGDSAVRSQLANFIKAAAKLPAK